MTQRAHALILGLLSLPIPVAAQTGSVEIWMRACMPAPGNAAADRGCVVETKFSLIPTGRGTAIVRPESQRTSGSVEKDHIGTPTVRDGVAHVAGQVIGGQGSSINYSFDLQWQPFPGELTATVSVGTFPAFEMYARTPGHEWVSVARTLPKATSRDASFTQLSESVTLPVLDGTWESDDAQRRFMLRIEGASVTWTERDAAGNELTRQLPIWFGDDAATISRTNDAVVLTFLGFHPELRDQILARSPIPSFITLTIDEQGLLAEWFGVLAIKDRQDQLKTLVQPGSRAPKRYRLQQRSTP
jgi:hypothetical protein